MNNSEKYEIITVVGPTASGKTAFSLAAAERLNAEILSADSRQIYIGMDVGTNKIPLAAQKGIPHYGIDLVPPNIRFTAADYESYALNVLSDARSKGVLVVVVGGTGLYINVLAQGLDPAPQIPQEISAAVRARLENEGLPALVDELQKLDPQGAATIDLQNPRRVTRALEICLASGAPFSTFRRNFTDAERPFRLKTYLLLPERTELYTRINERTEEMWANGLVEETERLYEAGFEERLRATIGYAETLAYLLGELTAENARSLIAQHTRNYAKRQITWFKKSSVDYTLITPNDVEIALQNLKYSE